MPNEWREVAIEDLKAPSGNALATGPFGSSIGSKYFTDSGIPVIRGNNLSEDVGTRLKDEDLVFLSPNKAEEFRRSIVREGDLVFTCWGTVNQVGLIDRRAKYREYVISNKQMKLTPDPAKADSLFLYYLFSSPQLQVRIRNESIGSSVPGFNLGQLRAMRFLIPGIEEQRAISYVLGTLDDKIEMNGRMNETLEAMARTLFKSWFVDFDPVRAKAEGRDPALLKPVADLFTARFVGSELGEIPEGWKVATVGDVADVIDCLHSKKPERRDTGRPLLQLNNIRDDGLIEMTDTYFIDEDDYRQWVSRMEASPGDCVITNVGRVGAVAQMPVGQKAALGRNMTGVRCKPAFPFPTVLIECLLSQAMKDEIALKMDTGTILDALNVRNIPKLRFVRPTDDILKCFEQEVRPLRALMEKRLAESGTLAILRDTLLPKLMSGELRIKDAERFLERAV